MKAIVTKYLPFTNHKPSRIKASADGVSSKVWTIESLENRENQSITSHQEAARLFAGSHGWSTNLASGGLPSGEWAHCFVTDSNVLDVPKIRPEIVANIKTLLGKY